MSIPRKIITVISAVISIVIVFFAVKQTDLGSVLDGGTTVQLISAASLAVSLTVLAFALGGGRDRFAAVPARRHSKKSLILAGILIALILPTLILGGIFLDDRKYYFISLAVLIEVMAAFFILFEGRRPKSREIAVMAVICALGIAGRAAFFMLPQFKPVAAIVIIAGMTLGGGSGFIVGAVHDACCPTCFSHRDRGRRGRCSRWGLCGLHRGRHYTADFCCGAEAGDSACSGRSSTIACLRRD